MSIIFTKLWGKSNYWAQYKKFCYIACKEVLVEPDEPESKAAPPKPLKRRTAVRFICGFFPLLLSVTQLS